MKYIILLGISMLGWSPLSAQGKTINIDNNPSYTFLNNPLSAKGIDLDDILEIFEESEPFEVGSHFLWSTYGLISNTGPRPDRTGGLIPPVSLNYEASVFANFGVRASGALHTWEENKTLARSSEREFKELFQYQYWTAGLGLTYHFNVSDRIDPYLGYAFTYRSGRAFCDCVDESLTQNSQDFFGGIRWLPTDGFYLQAELGSTNVSILEVGLGLRFSK